MTYQLDVLEDLIDDDSFIRAYPSFGAYIRAWDEMGGEGACVVPEEVVFEFYAEKVQVEEALHTWFTYDPVTQLTMCKDT
jgi:hypothetical protein